MKTPACAALALLACCVALPVAAGPGDVYVPAHRTADGQWVPANVPPSSGGTRVAKKPQGRAAGSPPAAVATPNASSAMPPLFVAAEPIRR
jgi:hypothetical protein